jgi:RND superfamily putative drug exporter
LAGVTDVSVYAINITTMMGLGLAIDYSLFIVSRYREELQNGAEREQAIVRAVQVGGRTVLFSAVAVAISLSALAVFPLYFLTSLAYAGVSVVIFAALVAVTFLPALLAAIGPRIDSLSIFHRRASVEVGEGIWGGVARFVMRRPLMVAVCTLAFLGVVGSPFLHANFGTADDRALPKGSPARIVSEKIRNDYSSSDSYPITVLAMNIGDPLSRASDLVSYSQKLSVLPNVARVEAITGTYTNGVISGPASVDAGLLHNDNATVINVYAAKDPTGNPGETLVRDVRKVPAPFAVGVTGVTASTVDSNHVLAERLPYAGAGIAIVMLVVLFLLTGSVVLPIKTVLLSMVSLTATFGAMVWVFQEGHLGSLFHITATEITDSTNPLLMFGIAFGLSMDYAVFLLARIKEEYDKGLSTEQAVVRGLEKSGRVVTAAATLIAIVFFSFGASSVVFLKLIGFGLALAILVDATIVRGLLVPSFMRLLGNANWWAPSFLRPVHERFGISEDSSSDLPEPMEMAQ